MNRKIKSEMKRHIYEKHFRIRFAFPKMQNLLSSTGMVVYWITVTLGNLPVLIDLKYNIFLLNLAKVLLQN